MSGALENKLTVHGVDPGGLPSQNTAVGAPTPHLEHHTWWCNTAPGGWHRTWSGPFHLGSAPRTPGLQLGRCGSGSIVLSCRFNFNEANFPLRSNSIFNLIQLNPIHFNVNLIPPFASHAPVSYTYFSLWPNRCSNLPWIPYIPYIHIKYPYPIYPYPSHIMSPTWVETPIPIHIIQQASPFIYLFSVNKQIK